jgi:hypothetical protein
MQWLAEQITGATLRVHQAESYSPAPGGAAAYRFFELFDLPNLPAAPELLAAAARGEIRLTPPIKPYLEEKLWLALFWMRPLRELWRRELGERHFLELQKFIPYTWILDPTPLPQHAVIPGLELQDWAELAHVSQKQRDLILKISGFSELGWAAAVWCSVQTRRKPSGSLHWKKRWPASSTTRTSCSVPQRQAGRAALLHAWHRRAPNPPRPRAALPILLCHRWQGAPPRRAGDDRPG